MGLGCFLIYSINRLNGWIELASEAHEHASVKPCLGMKGVTMHTSGAVVMAGHVLLTLGVHVALLGNQSEFVKYSLCCCVHKGTPRGIP